MVEERIFCKTDFAENHTNGQSKASLCIKNYLEMFRQVVHRGGNGLKTPKFHQMLRVRDYKKMTWLTFEL